MPKDVKEENGNRNENGLTTHEKLIWGEIKDLVSCQNKEIVEYLFVKHVMKPLLGHKNVNAGVCFLLFFDDFSCLQYVFKRVLQIVPDASSCSKRVS